jgi:HK97 family phage portal protein
MATSLRSPAKWLLDFFGGNNNVRVTETSILASPTVWYCISTIAGDVAKMPLEVKREDTDGGNELYKRHSAYNLLAQQSNEWQTADCFKELITAHALGWGNGRAAIIRNGTRPVELIPLMPDRTETIMVQGEVYHVTMPEEDDALLFRQVVEEMPLTELLQHRDVVVMHDSEVLHVKGFGYNGYAGLSVAQVLKDTLGIDLQAQKYANNGMKKGFAGEVMLEAPAGMFRNEDDAKAFLDGFRKRHARGQDGETVGLLREGIKANVLNMSPADSQFLEQRAFSRQDIGMIFGMQSLPFDDTATSYNSLEQKQLAYLASCLDRWLTRIEFQCDMKLRTEPEKRVDAVHFKFDRATWLRTDAQTKQEVLSGLISSTIINRNEARLAWGLNPVEGGDEFLNPFTSTDEDFEEDMDEETTDETPGDDESIVEGRLQYLISLESQRIIEMSDRKDFLDQLDGFYTKWAITLLNNGIPADKVKSLTEEHKNGILERAGQVAEMEQLGERVRDFAREW